MAENQSQASIMTLIQPSCAVLWTKMEFLMSKIEDTQMNLQESIIFNTSSNISYTSQGKQHYIVKLSNYVCSKSFVSGITHNHRRVEGR